MQDPPSRLADRVAPAASERHPRNRALTRPADEPAQAFFRLLVHSTRAGDFKAAAGLGTGKQPPAKRAGANPLPGWLKNRGRARRAAKREAEKERGEGTTAMDGSDLFAKVDQQISALKERIARQHEVIKQAKLGGRSTAAAETIQHALHQSLRAFEKHRQQVFERMEAKRKAEEDWNR